MHKIVLTTVFAISCLYTKATPTNDALQECIAKLVPAQVAKFDYTYIQNRTYHSPKPWDVMRREHRGSIWVNDHSFTMSDTITFRGKDYSSAEQLTKDLLLYIPIGKEKPVSITRSQLAEEVFEIAKFHPAMLLMYFAQHETTTKKDGKYQVYTGQINGIQVKLFINKKNNLPDKVTILRNEDVFGDVTYTVKYTDYTTYNSGDNYYAQQTTYNKLQPHITDTLQFRFAAIEEKAPALIEHPADYTIAEDKPKEADAVNREKITDHLYALHLPQAESAALLAEFNGFFVVIDAPMNSRNGELVLQEAAKIAPGKPVKYYSFCHHHPWYIGGVRPFIHDGATVFTQASNKEYLQFIATNPHTVEPDSQYLDPKPLLIEEVGETKTITDGSYEMVMYHIGEKSTHTEDYTLFYFPQDKILFQGDMVFIKKEGPLSKAGSKQKALYDAVKDLGIEVETIVQAWPWASAYKTVIPFSDLEETVMMSADDK